jgi:hypothetical protein
MNSYIAAHVAIIYSKQIKCTPCCAWIRVCSSRVSIDRVRNRSTSIYTHFNFIFCVWRDCCSNLLAYTTKVSRTVKFSIMIIVGIIKGKKEISITSNARGGNNGVHFKNITLISSFYCKISIDIRTAITF